MAEIFDSKGLSHDDSDIKEATRPMTDVSSSEEKAVVIYPQEEEANRLGSKYMGKYRRTFLSRHIQIVTLGSNIGSGLFISTGKALRNAGPGNMIIGYTLVMTMVRLS